MWTHDRPKPPPIYSTEYMNYSREHRRVTVWQSRVSGAWYVDAVNIGKGTFPPGGHGLAMAKAGRLAHGAV